MLQAAKVLRHCLSVATRIKPSTDDYIPRLDLLKDEFLEVPVRHLENVMGEHKTLGKAYSVIEEQLRNYQTTARHTFRKISKGRNKRGAEPILVERGSSLPKELRAAKQKSERDAGKYLKSADCQFMHLRATNCNL